MAGGPKSELELAVETLGHVWERAQRLKIVRRKSVQVIISGFLIILILHIFFVPILHILGLRETGKWQEWGRWSQCSTTCGPGHRVRARACDGPQGSCDGEPTEYKRCNVNDCPGYSFCSLPYIIYGSSSQGRGKMAQMWQFFKKTRALLWQNSYIFSSFF